MRSDEQYGPITDDVLREYMLGGLCGKRREIIERQLQVSTETRARLETLKEEHDFMKNTLISGHELEHATEISDETLALYLDYALNSEQRKELERELLNSNKLRTRLIKMHEYVKTVSDPKLDLRKIEEQHRPPPAPIAEFRQQSEERKTPDTMQPNIQEEANPDNNEGFQKKAKDHLNQ